MGDPAIRIYFLFSFRYCGCPAVAIFARAGTMLPRLGGAEDLKRNPSIPATVVAAFRVGHPRDLLRSTQDPSRLLECGSGRDDASLLSRDLSSGSLR